VPLEGLEPLIAKSIKKAEVVAYDDLGAEALRRLEVEDFRPSSSTTSTAAMPTKTA